MSTVLAVDPGANGGAFLRVDGKDVAWWAWTQLDRVDGVAWRVRSSMMFNRLGERNCGSMGYVGEAIRRDTGLVYPDYELVVEGLFVPRSRKGKPVNPQSAIPLAEAAGWLMGGLGMGVPVARPLASDWRPAVLCPASTEAKAAELLAVKATPWAGLPGDPLARLSRAELGAVAEARFIALWWERCGRKL